MQHLFTYFFTGVFTSPRHFFHWTFHFAPTFVSQGLSLCPDISFIVLFTTFFTTPKMHPESTSGQGLHLLTHREDRGLQSLQIRLQALWLKHMPLLPHSNILTDLHAWSCTTAPAHMCSQCRSKYVTKHITYHLCHKAYHMRHHLPSNDDGSYSAFYMEMLPNQLHVEHLWS